MKDFSKSDFDMEGPHSAGTGAYCVPVLFSGLGTTLVHRRQCEVLTQHWYTGGRVRFWDIIGTQEVV